MKKLTKVSQNRLLKLATFLDEEVKPKAFNLEHWKGECGTVFCAVGHAAVSPKFRGLEFTGVTGHNIRCTKTRSTGFEAAWMYFGLLTYDHAFDLFDEESYSRHRRGKKSVVNRIRAYVKKHA